MPDGSGHFADLPVAAFCERKFEPDVRDIFSETDRWIAGCDVWLRIENPDVARARFSTFDDDAFFQRGERHRCGNAFHERVIRAFVCVAWVEQAGVQTRLVGEQQQTFAIRVQPPQWVHIFRETEFRQCPKRTAVRRKLGKDAVRFVEGDQHSVCLRVEVMDSIEAIRRQGRSMCEHGFESR